jgi:hypothetical protein
LAGPTSPTRDKPFFRCVTGSTTEPNPSACVLVAEAGKMA